jgi:hypothetical protein
MLFEGTPLRAPPPDLPYSHPKALIHLTHCCGRICLLGRVETIQIKRPHSGHLYVCELRAPRGLLGFGEASDFLGVHRITLLRWAKSKRMRTVRYQRRRAIPLSEAIRLKYRLSGNHHKRLRGVLNASDDTTRA